MRGVFGPDSRASFSGGLAHRVFARHLGQGSIDPDGFNQVCREEIGSSSLNMKMAALGLGKPSVLAPLIEEVQALYQRFRNVPVDGFVGAEVDLAAEPADGVNLVGKVDAVFGDDSGPRLVDWKTGELGIRWFSFNSTRCSGRSRRTRFPAAWRRSRCGRASGSPPPHHGPTSRSLPGRLRRWSPGSGLRGHQAPRSNCAVGHGAGTAPCSRGAVRAWQPWVSIR